MSENTITLNFKGDPDKPHEIIESDYNNLKSAGLLWELFPDAPDMFPVDPAGERNGDLRGDSSDIAEALFLHFAKRRTEGRRHGPESIKVFCMLSKEQFIEWAREFFDGE